MSDFPYSKVLITGGTGTLGHAILRRAVQEKWDTEFSILSRDPNKQHATKEKFPELKISFVTGDVLWSSSVIMAMEGCDLVIHAAAMKHIPEGERDPISALEININGSANVAICADTLGVKQIIAISTDKACNPCTAYGASKMMMERIFQSWSKKSASKFNLCRYGNVLGSNGSVLKVWREMEAKDGIVHATNPNMTRFWLSTKQAVDVILHSLSEPSGTIAIPDLPGLQMGVMARWVLRPETKLVYDVFRPLEKPDEDLISLEESKYTEAVDTPQMRYYRLWPTDHPVEKQCAPFNSLNSERQMSWSEFKEMLRGVE